jgi:Fic family protein
MGITAELILPKDVRASRSASYRHKNGQITQVRRGVYVDSLDQEVVKATVTARWLDIAESLCPPHSVIAYRTAGEMLPAEGEIFVVSDTTSRRLISVGDYLVIHIIPGVVTDGVRPLSLNLSVVTEARLCLENLAKSSGRRKGVNKALEQSWVELYLTNNILKRRGEDVLNDLRDEARRLAPILNLEREFESLNEIIQGLLNTHITDKSVLKNKVAIAAAIQEPYDAHAVERFQEFAEYISRQEIEVIKQDYSSREWRNISFFEAYFSNYIEGTEFTLEEAEEIIFQGKIDHDRPKDSHDILGTYDIASDRQDMLHTPSCADDLISLIQLRHERMMKARPEANPGQLKTKRNRAGNTTFVAPDDIVGTLTQAIPIYEDLDPGLARGIFMHFVISDCHPVIDGNGRLSRLFLNAELYSAGLAKIIVPTVHRESYLTGLRQATRNSRFRTIVKVLHQLHHYSANLTWDSYGDVLYTLREHMADSEEGTGLAVFNRVLSQWRFEYEVG